MAGKQACFDYFFRKLPFGGGYVVFAGLADALELLERFAFDADSIAYLRRQGLSDEFLHYLKRLKFTGNVWSVREGEVVFANEPVLRVEAPIIEAQLVETLLVNQLNFQSLIATKTSRIVRGKGAEDRRIRVETRSGIRRGAGNARCGSRRSRGIFQCTRSIRAGARGFGNSGAFVDTKFR